MLLLGQSLYMGVLTDNVPQQRRGWVFGLRTFFSGLGGVSLGFAASWVLNHWASPLNYRLSFLICDTFWTLSSLSLLLLRDKPARALRQKAAGFFRALLAKIRILLNNPNYRIFLFFHMLNSVAMTICSFIIPYAAEKLGVPDAQIAWLSVIYLASSVVFGLLMGRLADRAGFRSVGAVQSFLLLAFFLIAMSSRSFLAVCIAWTLFSIVNISGSFMLVNMSVELCPSLGASDLTALGGVMLLPFVAVISPLAGSVIDTTGSYLAVFFIGATIAFIAFFGFALLVREPRTGKLYAITQITMN
jgi:MFS family permease